MKRLAAMAILVTGLTVSSSTIALAGQPNTSCGNTNPPNFPGRTGTSPGSAFAGKANGIYANPLTQGGLSSGNPKVVSQYDVACLHNASHS